MTVYAYARVSKADGTQTNDNQLIPLQAFGYDVLITDEASGSTQNRTGWNQLMASVKAGDTIVCVRVDRLGRRASQLLADVDALKARGVSLKAISGDVDPSTASGMMMLTIMAGMAEYERATLIERTVAGIERARSQGKSIGRPVKDYGDLPFQLQALKTAGMTGKQIAQKHGISEMMVSRILRKAAA